jgi:hypothetical protein
MYVKATICCLALWSAGALAQDKMGAYLGGGLGQFDFQEEGDGSLAIEDTALFYRVYGGYRFNGTFAVEGAINGVLTGPISVPVSDTDSGALIVLGGQWDLERVGIRVELEAYDMGNVESAYNFGLGVHYRF